jgi:hypothetical protein
MKNKQFLTAVMICSIAFIQSCNPEDFENPTLPPPDNTSDSSSYIEATWRMDVFDASFGGYGVYNGEITWTINSDSTIDVVIQPGTQVFQSMPFTSTGNYQYSLNSQGITFNGGAISWAIDTIGEQLILNNGPLWLDGTQIQFTKIP